MKGWIIDRIIVGVELVDSKIIKKRRFHDIEELLYNIRIIGNKKLQMQVFFKVLINRLIK